MHGIGKTDVITFWFLLPITVVESSLQSCSSCTPRPSLLTSWVTLDMLCFTLFLSSPTDIINPVHYLRFMMTNMLMIKLMRAKYPFLSCAMKDCISKNYTVATCMELTRFSEQFQVTYVWWFRLWQQKHNHWKLWWYMTSDDFYCPACIYKPSDDWQIPFWQYLHFTFIFLPE